MRYTISYPGLLSFFVILLVFSMLCFVYAHNLKIEPDYVSNTTSGVTVIPSIYGQTQHKNMAVYDSAEEYRQESSEEYPCPHTLYSD